MCKISPTMLDKFKTYNYICTSLNNNVMKILAVRDFRNQLASSLDSVDSGEHVFIRRKNKLYMIVSVEDDNSTITPELAAKIDKAREEYRQGNYISCSTKEELQAYLDSL